MEINPGINKTHDSSYLFLFRKRQRLKIKFLKYSSSYIEVSASLF